MNSPLPFGLLPLVPTSFTSGRILPHNKCSFHDKGKGDDGVKKTHEGAFLNT